MPTKKFYWILAALVSLVSAFSALFIGYKWLEIRKRTEFVELIRSTPGIECQVTEDTTLTGGIIESKFFKPSVVVGFILDGEIDDAIIDATQGISRVEYLIMANSRQESQQRFALALSDISTLTIHLNPKSEPQNSSWLREIHTREIKCMTRGTSWEGLPNLPEMKNLFLYSPTDNDKLPIDFVSNTLQANPQLKVLTIVGDFLTKDEVRELTDRFPRIEIRSE